MGAIHLSQGWRGFNSRLDFRENVLLSINSENYNQIKQQGKRYSISVVVTELHMWGAFISPPKSIIYKSCSSWLGWCVHRAEIHIDLQKFKMGTQLVLKLHLLVLWEVNGVVSGEERPSSSACRQWEKMRNKLNWPAQLNACQAWKNRPIYWVRTEHWNLCACLCPPSWICNLKPEISHIDLVKLQSKELSVGLSIT